MNDNAPPPGRPPGPPMVRVIGTVDAATGRVTLKGPLPRPPAAARPPLRLV